MYQWDEVNRITSLANHGVDFATMEAFEWESAIQRLDASHSEPRFVSVGYIGDRLHVVVFAEHGDRIRLVSLRRATASERKRHAET